VNCCPRISYVGLYKRNKLCAESSAVTSKSKIAGHIRTWWTVIKSGKCLSSSSLNFSGRSPCQCSSFSLSTIASWSRSVHRRTDSITWDGTRDPCASDRRSSVKYPCTFSDKTRDFVMKTWRGRGPAHSDGTHALSIPNILKSMVVVLLCPGLTLNMGGRGKVLTQSHCGQEQRMSQDVQ